MTGPLGILGPGALGLSLSQWAAERGLEVRLLGRDTGHAEGGLQRLEARWHLLAERGKISKEEAAVLTSRVSPHGREGVLGCATILEALPEDPDLMGEVWRELAALVSPQVLCLTGSSALPVGPMAAVAGLKGRLLGFHLFLPVRSMRVVELVAPEGTDPAWVGRAEAFGNALGLRLARVKDGMGYAAARMSLALGLEAMRLLEEGVASAEDLDALMRMGYGHSMGPLEVSDHVGLDLRLAIADRLREAHGERFSAPETLRDLVDRGQLGRKSGRGFHDWSVRP